MVAMMTACDPGDQVIVLLSVLRELRRGYDSVRRQAIYVSLAPAGFGSIRRNLRRAFEQRPKALVLCNPENPSGKGSRRRNCSASRSWRSEHDTFVITDEVYEHIIYGPHRHLYFASLPGMFQRTAFVQLAFQDLLHHRLAAWLCRRAAGGNARAGEKGP